MQRGWSVRSSYARQLRGAADAVSALRADASSRERKRKMTLTRRDALARSRHGDVPPSSDGHHIAARGDVSAGRAVTVDSALRDEPQQHIRDHAWATSRGNCL